MTNTNNPVLRYELTNGDSLVAIYLINGRAQPITLLGPFNTWTKKYEDMLFTYKLLTEALESGKQQGYAIAQRRHSNQEAAKQG